MRQDFESPCSSGSPAPSAANLAAASPFSSAPRPRIPGGTLTPLCLPASSLGTSLRLPVSILPSAQSRKNNPPSQFPPSRPVRVHPGPVASTPSPARPASSPHRCAALLRTPAPCASWTPPAQFESPRWSAASPAPALFQIVPAACARACAHRDASARFPRLALSESARPTRSPPRSAPARVSLVSETDAPARRRTPRCHPAGSSPLHGPLSVRHRSSSGVHLTLTPARTAPLPALPQTPPRSPAWMRWLQPRFETHPRSPGSLLRSSRGHLHSQSDSSRPVLFSHGRLSLGTATLSC